MVLKHFNIMFQIRCLFFHLLLYLASCFRTYVPYFLLEIKNFSSLKPENFRQALSYATENYGKFIIIVNRS